MKAYGPNNNHGRTTGADDVHHKTRDLPKSDAIASGKALRHAARQDAQKQIRSERDSLGNKDE